MDPVTHTLVGANLASTGLRAKTRLATAALVIGANLPDVDAILYFTGHRDFALHFRRGWTHGVLALVVLPFVLTGLLLLYDRIRPDPACPADPRWLFALSSLAILTHPTLDWLNNYGMRWLMPFDRTWFYGDCVYIMDPWLWLVLGAGWLAGRKPTKGLVAAFTIVVVLLSLVVAGRAVSYLGIVAAVALPLVAAMIWSPPEKKALTFARTAIVIAVLYIGARLSIHAATARRVAEEIRRTTSLQKLMVAPHPIDPFTWDVVAQTADGYRTGTYSWSSGLRLHSDVLPLPVETPEWERARRDPSVRGFVGWARFPWYEIERNGGKTLVHIYDARYMPTRGRGFGGAVVDVTSK